MQSKKHLSSLALVILLVICAAGSCYGSVAEADSWRDLGSQTLYFFASDRCPLPNWLQLRQELTGAFAQPNSRGSVLVIESFLEQALEGYEIDNFTWRGRIPLDINPRCTLGLYLADKFPGTKLADTGKRQFEQSIERSCMVTFGLVPSWQKLLETELVKTDEDFTGDFSSEHFDRSEVPFLLVYLVENGSCEAVRKQAGKQLAYCLERQYGLEPALRQYCVLLQKAYTAIDESAKLNVAKHLQQTGAICDAEQLYKNILQKTDLPKIATTAAGNLAQIKLANSRQIDAWQVFDILRKRFPNTELLSEDWKGFFLKFQADSKELTQQIIAKLQTVQEEKVVLKLCWQFDGLWTKQQACDRWQYVIGNVEPESLASRFARLHLARSLANTGKTDEAKDIVANLTGSSSPAIRAGTLLVSADIALGLNRISEAVGLYQQAAQIERPTTLPQWLKTFEIKQLDVEDLTSEGLRFFASFLRGYNELADGNFRAAAANLLKAREATGSLLRKSLSGKANKSIPSMLMLAYTEMGDYARAEQYGFEAISILEEDRQDSKQVSSSTSQIEKVDNSLFVLFGKLRTLKGPDSKSQFERCAGDVYTTVTTQYPLSTDSGATKSGLSQLLWQIKKHRVARLLSAEYDWSKTRLTKPDNFKKLLDLEPVIFTAQLLDKDSLEQISDALVAISPQEYAEGQMYRFALFSQQVKRPYMAQMALNMAAMQIDSVRGNVELLENIAYMHIAGNNHQKAVEIYQRIVEQVPDPNEAQEAQLEIIKIYTEDLKLYGKAITQCQKYLKKFPDSGQIRQVEFLMGKLAYLSKDYIGAAGQLDRFQKRYPDDVQTGEAMMLAALSCMSDGNTDNAVYRFKEIIEKYPEDDLAARSKFLVGYAQVSAQKYSRALETFKQLIEQFPKSKYTNQARSFIDRLSKMAK